MHIHYPPIHATTVVFVIYITTNYIYAIQLTMTDGWGMDGGWGGDEYVGRGGVPSTWVDFF